MAKYLLFAIRNRFLQRWKEVFYGELTYTDKTRVWKHGLKICLNFSYEHQVCWVIVNIIVPQSFFYLQVILFFITEESTKKKAIFAVTGCCNDWKQSKTTCIKINPLQLGEGKQTYRVSDSVSSGGSQTVCCEWMTQYSEVLQKQLHQFDITTID